MAKTGQAAMEFLLTYGWAILVVITVIGTLSYFGVITPDTLLPEKCALPTSISCIDHQITKTGRAMVMLSNGFGQDIKVYSVNFTSDAISAGSCSLITQAELENATNTQILRKNAKTAYEFACPYADTGRLKNKYAVRITYSNINSDVKHVTQGELLAKAEGGEALPEGPPAPPPSNGSSYWITDTQQEFDQGTYAQAQSIAAGSVQLSAGQSAGAYTSNVFDAGAGAIWDNVTWVEALQYKEHLTPDGTICADSSVKGMWYLDGSSGTATDYSFCGKSGSNFGLVSGVPGKIGTAYEFDGVDDYVDMAASLFPPVPRTLTVTAWAKTKETGNIWVTKGNTLFYHGWDGEFGFGQDYLTDKPFLSYDWVIPSDNNPHWAGIIGTTVLEKGRWYHFAVTWDSINDKAEIYINGLKENETTLGADWELRDAVTYHPTTIGANTQIYGRDYLWNGTVDEVTVYNRVLSPTEILNQYKQGTLNITFEVRSCDDPICSGESFTGAITNSSTQALSVPNNQYFQYRVKLETENTAYTPFLEKVTVGYTIP